MNPVVPMICPCHNSTTDPPSADPRALCAACVRRALHTAQSRRQAAARARKAAQAAAATASSSMEWAMWQDESAVLRDRLARLRQACAATAVKVCAAQADTADRQVLVGQARQELEEHQGRLDDLQSVLLCPENGSLHIACETARSHVRQLRFSWAVAAFGLIRLDVSVEEGEHETVLAGRRKHARGIGKIGGLPLPHTHELFGVLPAEELQSALRWVAVLTSTVARCLGILVPHPILLQPSSTGLPNSQNEDIIASVVSRPSGVSADSLSQGSGGQHHQQARFLLEETTNNTSMSVPPSMDPEKVQQRLKHAQAAVLAEDGSSSNSQHYSLATDTMHQEEFAIALQLLQNNVVAVAIRAGVPVCKLWPAEALLLNLCELQRYCQAQIQQQDGGERLQE